MQSIFFLNEKILLFVVEQSIGVSNFPKFLEIYHQKVKCATHIQRIAQRIVQVALISSVFLTKLYEDVDAGERCHVRILDKYLQKLPPNAYELDIFYL